MSIKVVWCKMQFLRLATNSLILFVQTRAVKNLVLLLVKISFEVRLVIKEAIEIRLRKQNLKFQIEYALD